MAYCAVCDNSEHFKKSLELQFIEILRFNVGHEKRSYSYFFYRDIVKWLEGDGRYELDDWGGKSALFGYECFSRVGCCSDLLGTIGKDRCVQPSRA